MQPEYETHPNWHESPVQIVQRLRRELGCYPVRDLQHRIFVIQQLYGTLDAWRAQGRPVVEEAA